MTKLALAICNGIRLCVNDGVRIIFGKGTDLKIQESKFEFFQLKVNIFKQIMSILQSINSFFLIYTFF